MPDPVAMDTAPRVVMLARSGKAADNLADALRQAGADLLMVADPANTDEAALRAHRPQAVLVALEPSIEHALGKFDGLLMDPSLTVIFDEADVAAHRAGWDAARWVRHLAAKLRRDTNVLPPGAESDQEWQPSPGQIPKPSAAYADVDMAIFAEEAVARAESVPADGMPTESLIPVLPPETASAQHVLSGAVVPMEPRTESPALQPAGPDGSISSNETGPVLSVVAETDVPRFAEIQLETSAFDDALPLQMADDEAQQVDATVNGGRDRSTRFDDEQSDSLSLDSLSLEHHVDVAATSGIAPMNLDEDAFFLEELSASESFSTVGITDTDLSFGGFDIDADDNAGTGRGLADLELPDLDAGDFGKTDVAHADFGKADLDADDFDAIALDATGVEAMGFDAGDLDVSDADAIFSRPRPERQMEEVISFEELMASSIEAAEALPAADRPGDTAQSDKPASKPGMFSLGDLSLAPVDDAPLVAATSKGTLSGPDISAFEARISSLSLVDIDGMTSAASAATPFGSLEPIGVVLIEAGLGGPDPARQLLSTIPAEFPAIVLVRLHLQGGRYDRLVAQMERAAALPVALAENGGQAVPGTIYFLPDGIGLTARAGGLSFVNDAAPSANLIAALPVGDSAVVFLSGSDPQLIDTVMASAGNGLMVIAQSPEDCYDGAACAELRARGAVSGLPAELAGRLSSRWPS